MSTNKSPVQSQGEVTWLRLDSSRLPQNARVNFSNASSALGPLFTAAVMFEFAREGSDVAVRGSAKFKIPLKGEYAYRAEAHAAVDLLADNAVQFDLVKEEDLRAGTSRTYMPSESGVEISYIDKGPSRSETLNLTSDPASAKVHSPYLLLPALVSSWSDEVKTYGSLVVIGRKFYAVKLEVLGQSLKAGVPKTAFEIEGSIAKANAPLDKKAWALIDWNVPTKFLITFDSESGEILDVGFNAPIIGRVAFSAKSGVQK